MLTVNLLTARNMYADELIALADYFFPFGLAKSYLFLYNDTVQSIGGIAFVVFVCLDDLSVE